VGIRNDHSQDRGPQVENLDFQGLIGPVNVGQKYAATFNSFLNARHFRFSHCPAHGPILDDIPSHQIVYEYTLFTKERPPKIAEFRSDNHSYLIEPEPFSIKQKTFVSVSFKYSLFIQCLHGCEGQALYPIDNKALDAGRDFADSR
jgi:hypothetical protein